MSAGFLNNIKVGNVVVYTRPEAYTHVGMIRTIEVVNRTTNTQVIIKRKDKIGREYDLRFYKKNGKIVGDTGGKLLECTTVLYEEVKEEMERKRLINRLQKIKFSDLTTSALYGIEKIIKEDKK